MRRKSTWVFMFSSPEPTCTVVGDLRDEFLGISRKAFNDERSWFLAGVRRKICL